MWVALLTWPWRPSEHSMFTSFTIFTNKEYGREGPRQNGFKLFATIKPFTMIFDIYIDIL